MNIRKFTTIVALVLSTWGLQSCGKKTEKKADLKPEVNVEIETAKLEDTPEILSFSGKLEAKTHSNLSTRIMGQIAKIYVESGQEVKKGQLLVQIHNKDILAKKAQIKANQMEAEAAYNNAKKDFDRYSVLFEQKSASQKEMDDVSTQHNMANARLEAVNKMDAEVEEMLRYANIKAPYSGIITRKYRNEGDLASPGMPLVAIEKPNEFKVMARIPETEISKIGKNDLVQVAIRALGDVQIDGIVAEVNPSAIYTGNQFEAKVVLKPTKEQKEKLYSGMYATVQFKKAGMPGIMIPSKVLIKKGQLTGIYVVSQRGTAMLRWVRTGKTLGDRVEVLSGLGHGERYILSYTGKIWDGAVVNVQ